MQYRRLTAHLQTGSADFNRRLSAYLTNHVAMRSALDQAISNSYAQQYPHAPQYPHNQNMYPSPFMSNTSHHQSPRSYGQPYPTPSRSQSHSQPQNPPTMSPPVPTPSSATSMNHSDQRRQSPSSRSSYSPSQQRSSVSSTSRKTEEKREVPQTQMRPTPQPSPHHQHQPFQNVDGYPNTSPFSMSLPLETQMLLGGTLDPNDSMTSAMMGNNQIFSNPYDFPSQSQPKARSFSHSYGGMSSTLAPSALDMQSRQYDFSQPPTNDSIFPASAPPSQLNFDNSDFSKAQPCSSSGSLDSGNATPGVDVGWEAFINDNSWVETPP